MARARKSPTAPAPISVSPATMAVLDAAQGITGDTIFAEDPIAAAAEATPADGDSAFQEAPGEPAQITPDTAQFAEVDDSLGTVSSAPDTVMPTAPESEEFPDFLLEAAGLTREDAEQGFGTPEALRQAITAQDARQVTLGQQILARDALNRRDAPPQQAPPIGEATPATTPEFKMPTPSHGGEWDDDAKQLINAMREYHDQQLSLRDKELNSQRESLAQLMNAREDLDKRDYVGQFDAFVGQLGEGWASVFGKGSGFELPAHGLAMANRLALAASADELKAARKQLGHPALPLNDLLARSLFVTFPQYAQHQMERSVTEKVAGRKRQFTTRPSSVAPRPKTGRETALATVNEWYRSHGLGVDHTSGATL